MKSKLPIFVLAVAGWLAPAEQLAAQHLNAPRSSGDTLRAYEGSYRSDELRSTWTFTAEPGKLIGHHERSASGMDLTPTGPDRFSGDRWAYRQVEFVRDERGRIVAVLFSSERFRDERFERVAPVPGFPR
jgi:hypothetical protein